MLDPHRRQRSCFITVLASAIAGLALLATGGCSAPAERETAEPAWAPERASLVFTSNRSGNAEIYVIADGATEWTNLTRRPSAENWPVWSPDGRRIAYQSNRDGNLDVWVMDADGANPTQLTDDSAQDYLPAWSPDGSRLTFASWRREPGDTDEAVHIYVMNADGSGQRRLLADGPGTSTAAQWAPDGQSLLLSRKVEDHPGDLFIVDLEGRLIRRLTDDTASNGGAEFSPDGMRVAFHSSRSDQSDIVVMNVDGSGRRTVVSGGLNYYPRWSPDGRWLLYTAAEAGDAENLDIYAVQADGQSSPVRLAASPGREAEGRWRPVR